MEIDQEYLDGMKTFHHKDPKVALLSREQFDALVTLAKDGLKYPEVAAENARLEFELKQSRALAKRLAEALKDPAHDQ